jgi:hypothetical protein
MNTMHQYALDIFDQWYLNVIKISKINIRGEAMGSIKTVGNSGQISLGKKFAGQTVMIDGIQTGVWVVKLGRFLFLVSPATGQKNGRSDRKRNLYNVVS